MTRTSKGSEADTAARLRLVIVRLARRLRREVTSDATPSALSALSTIDRDGPMTLGRLAASEGVRPPTMTRIVARLEGDGLVTRIPDTSDRRVTHVEPTAKGRELLRRNRARIDAYLRRRMSALRPEDAASLGSAIDLLERLLDEDGP